MVLAAIATQIALPLLLLAWLAIFPAASGTGFLVQAAGAGLVLLALALVALWTIPPWWMPFAYGVVWLAIVIARLAQSGFGFDTILPTHWAGWASLAVSGALGVAGALATGHALAGRQLPDVPVADIAFPLKGGTYLIGHGGSREIVNAHVKTLQPSSERMRAYRGQSYALDILKIDPLGIRARGLQPANPAAYAIFGEPVHAPCPGTVISSRSNLRDMRVPLMDRDNMTGNHVLIRCDDDVEVLLAHLRQGSVTVDAGERVELGSQVGEVGNSGNTSEPHLHIHAQRPGPPDAPFAGEPMAITFDGRFMVRNDLVRD